MYQILIIAYYHIHDLYYYHAHETRYTQHPKKKHHTHAYVYSSFLFHMNEFKYCISINTKTKSSLALVFLS